MPSSLRRRAFSTAVLISSSVDALLDAIMPPNCVSSGIIGSTRVQIRDSLGTCIEVGFTFSFKRRCRSDRGRLIVAARAQYNISNGMYRRSKSPRVGFRYVEDLFL